MAFALRSPVYIGADHAGFVLKEVLEDFLKREGFRVVDCGNEKLLQEDDYPDFAVAVARRVAGDPGSFGIAVCGSGAGVCIAANKVPGIRAAVAWDEVSAFAARNDDDANVLCLGARMTMVDEAKKIVSEWLRTEFQKEARFVRRVEKIARYETEERIRAGVKSLRREIVPAILEGSFEEAHEKLEKIEGAAHRVQIDVLDDSFAPGRTFPLNRLLTNRYSFVFEAHLMVADPESYVETCARSGFESVIFHWEAVRDLARASQLCDRIAKRGMRSGVAIGFETESIDILELTLHIDSVLILGVRPGKSGQEMFPDTTFRLQKARELFPPRIFIGVDGGVTQENLAECIESGADKIVASSMIFGSADPRGTIATMREALQKERV